MITAASPKPHNPGTHSSTHSGTQHPAEPAQAQEGAAPLLAPGPLVQNATHNSVTPGYVWVEFTNPAAVAITTGANSVYANLSAQGAAEYLTHLTQPLGCLVVTPPVLSLGSLTQSQTGMSAQGFPGFPVPVSNTSALPAGVGIASVVLNTSVSPPTITVNLVASGAGTVALGSRWLIFSMTGV